ncbi:hypothetical protein [Actinocrispum sp. NPDC049592]|uniref:hypothetical protein n=1 Tax=Actinocrispum sp. NPDC049592 TaxID=3154835 RepID=UPI0034393F63
MTRFAGAAWLLPAVLAVAGAFVPYLELRVGNQQATLHSARQTTLLPGDVPQSHFYWVVLLAGAVLLAVAGALTLRGTALGTARLIGTGGAGLVLGTAVVLLIDVTRFVVLADSAAHIEAGTWLLAVAALLPVAGIALTRPPRTPDDVPTPPMGIPVVRVLEPDYEEHE